MSVDSSTSSPLIVEGAVETLASDRTVDVNRDILSILSATATEFANHRISIDTSAYKAIRVSARRSSCSNCGPVATRIASGHYGSTFDLVTLPVTTGEYYEGSFSRVYEVPGTSILIEVRNTTPGSRQNTVAVEVAGRAN